MPHKKRSHGHHKQPKEGDESQPSRDTPKPAAQVSGVKLAAFEKASPESGLKPRVVTATSSAVAAAGSAAVGKAGKSKPETTAPPATVIDMSSAGATFVEMGSSGPKGGPKETKTAAAPPVRGSASTGPPPAATKPKETPRGSAKSAATTTTVRADVHKVAPAAGKTEAAPTKVQVEVPPAAARGAPEVDPFDALASILPSADSIAPRQPVYTGPEVTELNVTTEKGHKTGELDITLPPGYRFEDMPPADYKPADLPKPMSSGEALDSLSDAFMTSSSSPAAAQRPEKPMSSGEALDSLSDAFMTSSSATKPQKSEKPMSSGDALNSLSDAFTTSSSPTKPQKSEKKDSFAAVSASSAGPANFAPPPVKTVRPPADKKAKMEATACDFSLMSAMDAKVDTKPAAGEGDAMSLDALSALCDTLPQDTPRPELPEVRPEDVVSEDKHTKEKGVLVGEREDSIAPEYRFNKEELKKLPAPKPEPTMGTGEALSLLSGDLMTPSVAPAVQAPPPKQKAPVAVCPPAGKKAKVNKKEDDFSLEAGLDFLTVTKVEPVSSSCLAAPPKAVKAAAGKPEQGDAMSLDALSALCDTLPQDTPRPELPEVRPEDVVSEDKHTKEKGVLVGEREDSIAPEYRFNKEELKKLPAPKPEPTMCTGDALDILSGGFTTSSSAPAASPSAPPAQTKIEDLKAMDLLEDFVAPTKVSGVQAPAPPPTKKTPQSTVCPPGAPLAKPKADSGDAMSLDALSALCDTLPQDTPRPELPEVRPEDVVSEDKHTKEKGVLVGEREDSIAPEYRFNKEELKKLPAPKPEPTMCTGDALDILSGGFTTSSSAPAASPSAPPAQSSSDFVLNALAPDFVCSSKASTVKSSVHVPSQCSPELSAGGALDALDLLSDTLNDISPAPQPAPPPAKDLVKEKKAVEERLIKMGERDDSLPAEYRPTEEDLKKMAAAKAAAAAAPKEKSMDDKTALDLLSSDFGAAPAAAAAAPAAAAATKLQPPALDSEPLKPMAGAVLETLSGTLLPDQMELKTDKPKAKSKSKSKSKKAQAEEPPATEPFPAAPRGADVVPKSTKKGGRS